MGIRWFCRAALLPATLAALLPACHSGEDASAKGPVEVVLWEMMDPQERVLLSEHVATFQEAHPGIRVTTAHFGVEDVRNQFLTAALGGGGPDVVYGPSDQAGPLSVAGTLRPADEVFAPAFFERFHPLTQEKLGGHLWSVPEQFGNHLALVFNRALMDTPPADTDEMIAIARRNTVDADGDGTIDRYGIVFETKEPFWLVPWLGGFGGWVMDEENRPTLDTPAMASALAFVRDLKTKHRVLPRDCDYELADTLFREGRAAMIINGPWSWAAYRDAGVDIGIASIPEVTATGRWPSPMVSYRGYSFSRSCAGDRLAAAKQLVEYLTGPEVQRAYATRLGSLPSLLELQGAAIESDPILSKSMEQVRRGRPMPIVVEMRAVWDAMRPSFQNVMNGESTPEAAARTMQELAVRKIAEMRG